MVDSGNEIGLSEAEGDALPDEEKDSRRATVHERYAEAGADAGLNSLAELPDLIDELNEMLKGKR